MGRIESFNSRCPCSGGQALGHGVPDRRRAPRPRPLYPGIRRLLSVQLSREKGKLKRVGRFFLEGWLETRPETGLDCLICAEFARQRHLEVRTGAERPPQEATSALSLYYSNSIRQTPTPLIKPPAPLSQAPKRTGLFVSAIPEFFAPCFEVSRFQARRGQLETLMVFHLTAKAGIWP